MAVQRPYSTIERPLENNSGMTAHNDIRFALLGGSSGRRECLTSGHTYGIVWVAPYYHYIYDGAALENPQGWRGFLGHSNKFGHE